MNIQIRCEATLPKKLEKICEEGEQIDIRFGAIKGNKAEALIRMIVKDGTQLMEVAKIGITSIEFRIVDVGEEAPTLLGNETAVHSLFSRNSQITPSEPAPLTVGEPSKKEVSTKPEPQAPIPKNTLQAPVLVAPPPQPSASILQPIMSYAELIENLTQIKNIDTPMPEMKPKDGSDKLSRKEAQEYDAKLQNLPRLTRSVYIGANSNIVLNDLKQAIKMGEIIDFSKIPARKLVESRELRSLLLQKHLKFCTENEYLVYLNAVGSVFGNAQDGLPVGSQAEMQALMETGSIPPELAHRKASKPIVTSSDDRVAEQIDLDINEVSEKDLDAELAIFEKISESPTAPATSVARPAPKPSATVKPIRRAERE